jgi:hypothetical protein
MSIPRGESCLTNEWPSVTVDEFARRFLPLSVALATGRVSRSLFVASALCNRGVRPCFVGKL